MKGCYQEALAQLPTPSHCPLQLTHERHNGRCEDAAALQEEGEACPDEDGQVAAEPAEGEGELCGRARRGAGSFSHPCLVFSPRPRVPVYPPALITVFTACAMRPCSTELSSLTMRTRQAQSTSSEPANRMKPTAKSVSSEPANRWWPVVVQGDEWRGSVQEGGRGGTGGGTHRAVCPPLERLSCSSLCKG